MAVVDFINDLNYYGFSFSNFRLISAQVSDLFEKIYQQLIQGLIRLCKQH